MVFSLPKPNISEHVIKTCVKKLLISQWGSAFKLRKFLELLLLSQVPTSLKLVIKIHLNGKSRKKCSNAPSTPYRPNRICKAGHCLQRQ